LDTVPVQNLTNYFPTHGSGSGSGSGAGFLDSFKKILKFKFLESAWKQVDFNLELFNLFSNSDSF
jgi:hypothetical protein